MPQSEDLKSQEPSGIPTLDELLNRLALAPTEVEVYFALVAAGISPPLLRDNNAVLAAQAMTVLFNHIKTKV